MERTPDSSPSERYSRQVLYSSLGRDGQERLGGARVLVVGCGALGSHAAELLARAGVGMLRLVDRDLVELSNLHRQATFTEADAREGKPKAVALAGHLAEINSEIVLDPRAANFDFLTAEDLAREVDLILDGSDNILTRFLMNDLSLSRRIPWIYSGVVGETGHAQFFCPGQGPCLRCRLPDLPAPGELETCDTAGVLGPAVTAIASFQAAMALRYLTGGADGASGITGKQVRLGVWNLAAAISESPPDPGCPACAGGNLEFLAGRGGGEAILLCGRRAVQVLAPRPGELDLAALASRLRAVGEVEERRYMVRFRTGGVAMTIFPDGRAIVEGTTDPGRARALHARYVGH